jgi:polysaccharide pyruvyl transferase WcaK-like protein
LNKVLIPEDIPSANKGEAALFLGIAKSLEVIGPHRIELFTCHPEVDRQAYSEKAQLIDARSILPGHMLDGMGSFARKIGNYLNFAIQATIFGFFSALFGRLCLCFFRHPVWRSCFNTDIVLMCHDSFYAPLYHGPLILLFKSLGKPVILYGSTILPPGVTSSSFESFMRHIFNRFVLKKADWITLREYRSFNYLQSLGLKKIDVYPDLAFIVDTASDDEMARIFHREEIPENVALCGFAFSQKEIDYAYPDLPADQRRENALNALAAMMDHITGVLGLHGVFIPHAIGPTPRVDDRIAADWIRERCTIKEKVHIIRSDYSQQQLKGMAKRLALSVGMRLHFTIDAICHHVPSMLITHEDEYRCHGIIGDMLGQAKYVFNIESISSEKLIRAISTLWCNRAAVRADLANRLPVIFAAVREHAFRAKEILEVKRKEKNDFF